MGEKWYWLAIIAAIIMFGLYEITELSFDRLERMQKTAQTVIEK
jgi:sensor domain CHASE-containing protein